MAESSPTPTQATTPTQTEQQETEPITYARVKAPVDVAAGSTVKDTTTETGVFYNSVKVFIAGILVFPLAISIQASFSESPKATLTMPADVRLYNLGRYDRVPVQVFVMETMAEDNQYILLFEGFITGNSYVDTAGQRQLVLNCVAYTEVFKDAKFKFITSIDEAMFYQSLGENNLFQGVFKPGMVFPTCLFYEGLGYSLYNNESFDTTNNIIKMPTQYLANLMAYLEEAGTSYAPLGRFNDSVVSKYYATLAGNLHLDRRFCWLPYFDLPVNEQEKEKDNKEKEKNKKEEDYPKYSYAWESENITEEEIAQGKKTAMFPVLYGIQTDLAIKMLTNTVASASKEYTLYDLLYFLIDRMEYNFLVIPNPAYQGKRDITNEDEGAELDKMKSATLSEKDMSSEDDKSPIDESKVQEVAEIMLKRYGPERDCARLVNFCVKPLLDDTFPPLCNVIFRSQVDSISTATQFNGAPTRIQVTNFIPSRMPNAVSGTNSEALRLYGSVDFYPCEKMAPLGKDEPLSVTSRALMSNQLLNDEKYTGPWITRDRAPSWMFYAVQKQIQETLQSDSNGNMGSSPLPEDATNQIRKMREQYMRRQLLRARILRRQLTAQCVFLPYITCGFPGVVFDAANTGFAFTGNVISYEHTITPTEMSTTVMLNGIRLLAEANRDEEKGRYPNPINSVHVITHRKERMSLVYNTILGTPEANTISGANAATWAEIIENWYGPVDDVEASPQTNIYKAYKLQRRNIVNLPDYATFMNMTYDGTDLNSEWLRDRRKLTVYNEIPLLQRILPVSELEKLHNEQQTLKDAIKAAEEEKKAAEEAAKKAQEEYNSTMEKANKEYSAKADAKSKIDAEVSGVLASGGTPSDDLLERQAKADSDVADAATKYAKTETEAKAKLDKQLEESAARIKAAEKQAAQSQQGLKDLNEREKNAKTKGTSSDKKFENFEDRDVREVLIEVRNETAKHYIY